MIYVTDANVHCDTKNDTCFILKLRSDAISSFDVPVSSFAQATVCLSSLFIIIQFNILLNYTLIVQSDWYPAEVAALVARAKIIPVKS